MQKYFINLERSTQRKQHMLSEARRIHLDGLRDFPAVDAKIFKASQLSPYYKPKSWSYYWELTLGMLATFESHRLLWEACEKQKKAPFLICEDDIILSKKMPSVIEELAQHMEKFDLVHLDASPGIYRLGKPQKWGKIEVAPVLQPLSSAAAYIISPSGAKKNAKLARNGFCDHPDDFITRPHKNYRVFQVLPAVAIQGMFVNQQNVPPEIRESEREAIPQLNTPISKGPIAYRLAKEMWRGTRRISRKYFSDRGLLNRGGSIDTIPLAKDLPNYRTKNDIISQPTN